ncbi:MAG: efflux RND transporter periplasmic adaptor subunit [Reyranellaceae bacterium]
MKRLLISAGIILAAGSVVAVWWRFSSAVYIETAVATRGAVVEAVYATGTVEPVNWAKVSPTVSGRLTEIAGRDNMRVRRGDVLARLDDAEARARVIEADARFAYWRDELARQRTLADRGVASREAFDRAQAEYLAAQAAQIVAARRLADLVLVSPMDGVVLRQDGEIGEVVDKLQTLFWVGQPRPLRAIVDVDEEDIPLVAAGQAALVKADAFPDASIEGAVIEVTPKGDPLNKSYRVRVSLPDDTRFHIGMTVETNIVVREAADALLVPIDALVDGSVFVVNDGSVERRKIRIGIRGRDRVEVLAGLGAGDRVALNPPAGLADGARVRVAR